MHGPLNVKPSRSFWICASYFLPANVYKTSTGRLYPPSLNFFEVSNVIIRNIFNHTEKWQLLALASDYAAFLFKVLKIC